jgi:hypothetical protein
MARRRAASAASRRPYVSPAGHSYSCGRCYRPFAEELEIVAAKLSGGLCSRCFHCEGCQAERGTLEELGDTFELCKVCAEHYASPIHSGDTFARWAIGLELELAAMQDKQRDEWRRPMKLSDCGRKCSRPPRLAGDDLKLKRGLKRRGNAAWINLGRGRWASAGDALGLKLEREDAPTYSPAELAELLGLELAGADCSPVSPARPRAARAAAMSPADGALKRALKARGSAGLYVCRAEAGRYVWRDVGSAAVAPRGMAGLELADETAYSAEELAGRLGIALVEWPAPAKASSSSSAKASASSSSSAAPMVADCEPAPSRPHVPAPADVAPMFAEELEPAPYAVTMAGADGAPVVVAEVRRVNLEPAAPVTFGDGTRVVKVGAGWMFGAPVSPAEPAAPRAPVTVNPVYGPTFKHGGRVPSPSEWLERGLELADYPQEGRAHFAEELAELEPAPIVAEPVAEPASAVVVALPAGLEEYLERLRDPAKIDYARAIGELLEQGLALPAFDADGWPTAGPAPAKRWPSKETPAKVAARVARFAAA